MKMRRPSAVYRRRTNASKLITSSYFLSAMEPFEGIFAQVAVQREKLRSVPLIKMFSDDCGSVVQSCVVVGEAVYDSVHRGKHRCSGWHKQINPDVNRSVFAFRSRKDIAGVEQPGFVVAAYAYLRAGFL